MFTRCPSCQAAFSITDQQLEIAAGMVRCGMCEHVFDSRLFLFDHTPETTRQDVDVNLESDNNTSVDLEFLDRELHSSSPLEETHPKPVKSQAENVEDITSRIDSDISSDSETADTQVADMAVPKVIADQVLSLENETSNFQLSYMLGLVVIAILIGLLAIQLLAVTKLQLIPLQYQPQLCKLITCANEIPRALDQIEVLNRSIYTHPSEKDALMVTLTIINRAQFSQPYPVIQLRFLNVAGAVIAARQFGANHYLNTEWQPQQQIEPNTPVSIKLEIQDVGEEVVSYDFDFL